MDLSVIIPSRNEYFLSKTTQDVLSNSKGDTEVIAVLDGALADPPLAAHERLTVIYDVESVGQRAASNQAAKVSKAKYIMKLDAHCAMDEGFDVKMLEAFKETGDNVTMVPLMRNLHAFDWVCPDGHRRYQGPSGPCKECGKETQKDVVWIAKKSPQSTSYCFDSEPHFQYFGEHAKRPEAQVDLPETMSIQGSCFMCTREMYFDLDLCSEDFHSWGQQGMEVACKTWLSGGRVVCNKRTWYAHMFRTQGGDFSFPYENPQSKIMENREKTRQLFFRNSWPKQKNPLTWLLKRFWPVKGWTDEDLAKLPQTLNPGPTKAIIYYTDSQLDEKIAKPVRDSLKGISRDKDISIICASLKKSDFGDKNIHFPSLKRGYVTMAKQILAALENTMADIVFFCEHDVLYHPSHFDFIPEKKDCYFYNTNVWKVRIPDGHALWTDDLRQLSGMCTWRDTALEHVRKRVEILTQKEKELSPEEFNKYVRAMGFEPGTHGRPERVDELPAEDHRSEHPNIDIRHDQTLTANRWYRDQFRNEKFTKGWTESDVTKIEGWTGFDFGNLFASQ